MSTTPLRSAALRHAATGTGATLVLTAAAVGVATPAHADEHYTVQRGDTVSHIAARTGVSVTRIAQVNALADPSYLRVGQVLTIPTGTPANAAPAATAQPATYTVVRGDTLTHIAARYGTTVAALAAANGIADPSLIRIGQVLTVPGAAASAPLVGDTFLGRTYPVKVVAAANANKASLLSVGVPSKEQMRALVASTARSMGVDAALALAVAYQESGFDHASVSPANAIGTMQVIPSSGDWASDLVGRDLNLLDPQDNVVAGVAILRTLLRTTPDLSTAIASYYQGQSSVKRNGMYADTKRYVANVRALMARFA